MYDFLKAGFSDEGSAFLLQFFALHIILQGDYIEFLVFSIYCNPTFYQHLFNLKKSPEKNIFTNILSEGFICNLIP